MRRLTSFMLGAIAAAVTVAPALAEPSRQNPSTRIDVLADGRVLLDGASATPADLERRFVALEHGDPRVLFYQENAPSPATPKQDQGVKLVLMGVIRHNLNLVLTTTPAAAQPEKVQ